MRTYKGIITKLPENGVLVFGSNTQGRHSKGAALLARQKFGAIYGQPAGLQGNSYAIITKDLTKKIHPSISPVYIEASILSLYLFAKTTPNKDYYIVYSNTGNNLNGYTSQEMADMFSVAISIAKKYGDLPDNIIFEEEFAKLITNENK